MKLKISVVLIRLLHVRSSVIAVVLGWPTKKWGPYPSNWRSQCGWHGK